MENINILREKIFKCNLDIIFMSVSFFLFVSFILPHIIFDTNSKKKYISILLKILSILCILIYIYYIVASYNIYSGLEPGLNANISDTKSNINYLNKTISEEKNEKKKELFKKMLPLLERFNKRAENIITYSKLIIGINSIAVLLTLIYVTKQLLNHKK